MAKIYSFGLDQSTLSAMIDDLSDLPVEELVTACKAYRDDPKNERFPRPAKLRAIINPTASTDALAKEAAGRVIQAVSKFGWPNGPAAQEFIGELGWRAVERFGGWPTICESLGTTISADTFYAQVRDLCRSTLELGAAGIHNQPIGLEAPNKNVLGLVQMLADQKKLETGRQDE
jgi:hypothetical protein